MVTNDQFYVFITIIFFKVAVMSALLHRTTSSSSWSSRVNAGIEASWKEDRPPSSVWSLGSMLGSSTFSP